MINVKILVKKKQHGSASGGAALGSASASSGISETALREYLINNGYATADDVNTALGGYATEQWVKNSLNGYATEQWVREQKYLTAHQRIYSLTMQSGKFAPGTFEPTKAGATLNVPTKTSHLDNDSDFATNVSVGKKLDRTVFNDLFEKVEYASGKWAIKAKYGLYSDSFISALGLEEGGGSGGGGGESYLRNLKDVSLSGLTGGQWLYYDGSKWINRGLDLSGYATESWVKGLGYLTKGVADGYYLTKSVADGYYQPKGNYLTQHQSLDYLNVIDIRNTTPTPAQQKDKSVTFWFNNAGVPTSGSWYSGFNIFGWNLTYASWQLAATANSNLSQKNLFFRIGMGDSWEDWQTVLTSHNYSSFLGNYVDLTSEQTITGAKTFSSLLTLGTRGAGAPTSEVNRNLISLHPISHTGGPWYINSLDNPTTAFLRILYKETELFRFSTNGELTAKSFIKSGGTASQFLKADGSVDGNTYALNSALGNYLPLSGGRLTGWLEVVEGLTITATTTAPLLRLNYSGKAACDFRLDTSGLLHFLYYNDTTNSNYRPIKASYFLTSSTTLCTNLNADLWDGEHITNFTLKKIYSVDLSSLSDSFFYPITFGISPFELDCEIHSPSYIGTAAYNQNMIHFLLTANGWSDTPKSFSILSIGNYDNKEITIGAIGYGTQNGERCVWLRGGLRYSFYSNSQPTIRISDYTFYNEVYSVGTNLSGGNNANVVICWQNNDNRTSSKVALLSDNVASATQLQTARTIWGQSFNGTGNVSGDMTGVGSIVASKNAGGLAAVISATNTSSAQYAGGYYAFFPNQGTSNHNTIIMGGVSSARNNAATINYAYRGNNSLSSFLGLGFYDNDNILAILASGNVGIGTTTPSYKLHVAGVIFATTGIFSDGYVSAKGAPSDSDERLKTDFQTLSLSIHDIANAPSVTFRWRDGSGKDFGSIAQYWQRINPMFTPTGPKGFLGLQYGKIALAATKTNARGILELREQVLILQDTNAREILELRQKIIRLQEKIEVLEQKIKEA